MRRLENERLKEDMEDLNQQLERTQRVCTESEKMSVETARLKEDLDILRRSKEALERENERTMIALEKAETKVYY